MLRGLNGFQGGWETVGFPEAPTGCKGRGEEVSGTPVAKNMVFHALADFWRLAMQPWLGRQLIHLRQADGAYTLPGALVPLRASP